MPLPRMVCALPVRGHWVLTARHLMDLPDSACPYSCLWLLASCLAHDSQVGRLTIHCRFISGITGIFSIHPSWVRILIHLCYLSPCVHASHFGAQCFHVPVYPVTNTLHYLGNLLV